MSTKNPLTLTRDLLKPLSWFVSFFPVILHSCGHHTPTILASRKILRAEGRIKGLVLFSPSHVQLGAYCEMQVVVVVAVGLCSQTAPVFCCLLSVLCCCCLFLLSAVLLVAYCWLLLLVVVVVCCCCCCCCCSCSCSQLL